MNIFLISIILLPWVVLMVIIGVSLLDVVFDPISTSGRYYEHMFRKICIFSGFICFIELIIGVLIAFEIL